MEDNEDNNFVASEHDRLISAITKLDKTQHINEPTRSEPTNLNSEFNLIKSSAKLNLNNVVNVLKETAHNVQISKKLKKSQDLSKVLPKPLEKPQKERIKRSTGYEETKEIIGRWDPVVARSRTVDFVSFPLKQVSTKVHPTQDLLSKLKLKSSLEKELEEIDPPPPVQESDEDDEKLIPMSYQDMIKHRQHLAKLRAQQSYVAAKAKRQSKIKSKKYHRILKKEKLKQQLKEFEELQKKDPEEALKKLEALEKARALERHTLRHKNTGKWAKSKLVRAKYDSEVRQQLAEQLAVSRGLTQKIQEDASTDDEADNNEIIPDITLSQDPMNQWVIKRSDKSNVDAEFDFSYKKYIKDKIAVVKDDSDTDSGDDPSVEAEVNNIKSTINLNALNTLEESDDEKNEESDNNLNEKENKQQAKLKSINLESLKSYEAPEIKKESKTQNSTSKFGSTSNWTIQSPLKDDEKSTQSVEDVSSMFESFESKIEGKVQTKINKLKKNIEKLERFSKSSTNNKNHCEVNKPVDNLEYLKFKTTNRKPIIDEKLIETDKNSIEEEQNMEKTPLGLLNRVQPNLQENTKSTQDLSTFVQVIPKHLVTTLPDGDNGLDQLDDDEQVVSKINIDEAFEEDDLIISFRQEKMDEINKNKPENNDSSLPGWGSWGGKGVKAPKRKKNRFILKAPPKVPRRDENKGDIIIKEFKDPKLAAHKLKELPFPFTSVKEYEASIRTPLGNTFIPEKAHKQLIKPNVITKIGAIIEPMDEEELLVRRNRNFSNQHVIKLLAKK